MVVAPLMTDEEFNALRLFDARMVNLFAGSVAVSHAYAHIFDVGASVNVAGMEVRPGDLLHGDRHGVLTVPTEIAAAVPAVAADLHRREQKVIDFCRSSAFFVEKLSEIVKTKKS